MAKLTTPRVRVILDDPAMPEDEGNEIIFQPRNVELVAWDRERGAHRWPNADEAPFLWMTFLAWKYLQRTGHIEQCTLADFEKRCLSVSSAGDDDEVDPTQRAAVVT